MPLALTDEEKDLLLSLAAPIDQWQRTEFLAAVAAELEVADKPAPSESVRCIGWRARFRGDFSSRRSWRTPRQGIAVVAPPRAWPERIGVPLRPRQLSSCKTPALRRNAARRDALAAVGRSGTGAVHVSLLSRPRHDEASPQKWGDTAAEV
jgi:hypothetical protein